MQIHIRTIEGKCFQRNVTNDYTIRKIKKIMFDKTGCAMNQQKLFFAGKLCQTYF